MEILKPGQDFAAAVRQDSLDRSDLRMGELNKSLIPAVEKYNAKLKLLKVLGVEDLFRHAAESIQADTRKDASVIVTSSPEIDKPDANPKDRKVSNELGECGIKLIWNDSGADGLKVVAHRISVEAADKAVKVLVWDKDGWPVLFQKLKIVEEISNSDSLIQSEQEMQLTEDSKLVLNQALFDAYVEERRLVQKISPGGYPMPKTLHLVKASPASQV